jgi:2-polyprenyl-3-methyl-5-hydroxy-6-metoxy-1,4-benzoquinol methylase
MELKELINPITNKKVEIKNIEFFNGTPDLYISNSDDNIISKQSEFYNEVMFPNYDEIEDFGSLLEKSQSSIFTTKLDQEIPYHAKVLEAGCGTGQLSIALSRFGRKITGIDISKGSLNEAKKFIDINKINNVQLFRMNIFNIFFPKNYFDVIISNGVLHHTKDAKSAFQNLTKYLKPNGLIVIGLYHKYGRLMQNLRQLIIKIFGDKTKNFIDKRFQKNISNKKKYAWFKDQYQNPFETKHTFPEVHNWFMENGIEFINSIPFHFKEEDKIFAKQKTKNNIKLILEEIFLVTDPMQVYEGGFFVMIGRKKNNKKL